MITSRFVGDREQRILGGLIAGLGADVERQPPVGEPWGVGRGLKEIASRSTLHGLLAWATNAITEGRARFRIGTQGKIERGQPPATRSGGALACQPELEGGCSAGRRLADWVAETHS
jgi:hypothetical protein